MEAKAFCPAHITGFFTAHLDDSQLVSENLGSTGAGFSIKHGVTTSVRVEERRGQESNFKITTIGYESDKTDVSEFVVNEFLQMGDFTDRFFDIRHEITIPVGYGLGSSGASALSLSYALALFGETVFTMIPKSKEDAVLAILSRYPDGTIIKSELDNIGARVLNN